MLYSRIYLSYTRETPFLMQNTLDLQQTTSTDQVIPECNYFEIIHKYIAPDSFTYSIYLPHVIMVTHKALQIARGMGLSPQSLRFIEEAAMLHDIGVIKVNSPKLGTTGDLPYICHGNQGRLILESEGLPKHALVAERHTGVGISKQQIIERNLPIPQRDMLAESIEEKIISYADLFYSKRAAQLWIDESPADIEAELAQFGADQVAVFREWHEQFGKYAA